MLKELNRRVTEESAVVGYDNIKIANGMIRFATVDQPHYQMGQRAIAGDVKH